MGRREGSRQPCEAWCKFRNRRARVFEDPNYILIEDRTGGDGETRWHAIGLVGAVVLLVVHVYRSTIDEEQIIRIISARKARKQESRGYFQ